jgi:hypothetical protein
MLKTIFASNRPQVIVLLAIPALGFGILSWLYASPPEMTFGGPAFDWIWNYIGSNKLVSILLGVAVNLWCAYLANSISNAHSYMDKENYLPSLVLFLFLSIHLEWNYLNPASIGLLFVLLALRRILKVYRVQNVTSKLFDAGFLIGLGILFFPPLLLILPLIWVSLGRLRSFNLREWLVPLGGIMVPAIYAASFYWWFGYQLDFSEYIDFEAFKTAKLLERNSPFDYVFGALSTIVAIGGALSFAADMSTSTVHKKNTKAVFLWTSFFLLLLYLYMAALSADSSYNILILALPIGVFAASLFMIQKRKTLLDLVFYFWITLALLSPFVKLFA